MDSLIRLCPRDKLIETAEEMARKIASYDPMAVRNAKQAVVRGLDLPLAARFGSGKKACLRTSLDDSSRRLE